jgi:hypothetical protein
LRKTLWPSAQLEGAHYRGDDGGAQAAALVLACGVLDGGDGEQREHSGKRQSSHGLEWLLEEGKTVTPGLNDKLGAPTCM